MDTTPANESVNFASSMMECHQCGQMRPSEALVCPHCGALSYADVLERQSSLALGLEEQGRMDEALQTWSNLLPLVPENTKQALWIQARIHQIDEILHPAPPAPQPPKQVPTWVKKLGPFAPVAMFLLKLKSVLLFLPALLKLKFLLSFGLFIGFYCLLFGWRFGVGFALSILIHEMGHYAVARAKEFQVEMPNFIPGFGAWVSWRSPVNKRITVRDIAWISLAGPVAGLLAAVVCTFAYWHTHDKIWAALAYTIGWLNVLNLTPVWILDGGSSILMLRKTERLGIAIFALVMFFFVRNGMYLFVAAGAIWKLFTRDEPEQGSFSMAIAYIAVLAALGWVLANMNIVPQGNGF